MKEISTLDLRRNMESVVQQLRRGIQTTLKYKGKVVARLVPVHPQGAIAEDDPVYRLAELASPKAEPLTNRKIDQILYGKP